jgi:hypothetical protein
MNARGKMAVLGGVLALLGGCARQNSVALGAAPNNDPRGPGYSFGDAATAARGDAGPGAAPTTGNGGGFVDAAYSFDARGSDVRVPPPATARDAGIVTPPFTQDAAAAADAPPAMGSGGTGGGAGGAGGGAASDAAGAPSDTGSPEPAGCRVELRPLSTDSFAALVAGPLATVVVRAELTGGPAGAAPPTWRWNASYLDAPGVSVDLAQDGNDPAVAEIKLPRRGNYALGASAAVGGMTCLSGAVYATAMDPGRLFLVRAIPPMEAHLPVQHSTLQVTGGAAVSADLRLAPGTEVTIDPRDPSAALRPNAIASYVRISDRESPLVFEGFAGDLPFGALLPGGLRFDVLVVPAAAGGSGVGAPYAPLLVAGRSADEIRVLPFRLGPGVAVHGHVTGDGGVPLPDSRVALRGTGAPSTVGRTAADGSFEVLARGGSVSLVASPPPGSGLPEVAVADTSNALVLDEAQPAPTLELRLDPLPAANLRMQVLDPDGHPVRGARVLAQASLGQVGVLTVVSPSGAPPVALPAMGTMRAEVVTAADGSAALARLPEGRYTLLVAPDATVTDAAISAAAVVVDAADTSVRAVQLARKARIFGILAGSGDLGKVRLVATDVGTDLAVPPLVGMLGADGSFSFAVSPRRRYLLLAQPPPGSPFARSFVGNGTVEASPFGLRARLPASLPFRGRAISDVQRDGVRDTVMKVFCFPGAADCPDPTVPLAETITAADGAFELALPDPASR